MKMNRWLRNVVFAAAVVATLGGAQKASAIVATSIGSTGWTYSFLPTQGGSPNGLTVWVLGQNNSWFIGNSLVEKLGYGTLVYHLMQYYSNVLVKFQLAGTVDSNRPWLAEFSNTKLTPSTGSNPGATSPVAEPATAGLMGVGMIGLLALRKRMKKAA